MSFQLESAVVAPGMEVTIPFTIETDAEVVAFATVVNFDESLLQVEGIETVHVVPATKRLCGFLRLGSRQLYRKCGRLGINLRAERKGCRR